MTTPQLRAGRVTAEWSYTPVSIYETCLQYRKPALVVGFCLSGGQIKVSELKKNLGGKILKREFKSEVQLIYISGLKQQLNS